MINFKDILSSIGVVGGDLNATNKYDFYYGIEWDDGTFTYTEYEFYEKSGFDSRYDFFTSYSQSEYQFYKDIDDPLINNQYQFFSRGGEFFNLVPSANFTIDGDGNQKRVSSTYSFTNTSSNADTYSWDFGDGTSSSLENPTKVYSTAGDYTIGLTASDGGADPDYISKTASVYDYNIEFSSSNNQLEVTFTNETTTDNITVDSYEWDFGDGNTSTDTNPTHTYASAGTYTVNLVAYFTVNGQTVSDGHSEDVTVTESAFRFKITPDGSNEHTIYTTSSGDSFTVDWGDGSPQESLSGFNTPHTHTYSNNDPYTITIVSGTLNGVNLNCNNEFLEWGSDVILKNLNGLFRDAFYTFGSSFTYSATDTPDLSTCTSLENLFNGMSVTFNTSIGTWVTSNITNMSGVFDSVTNFNEDISSWDVSNVTNFSNMFFNCTSFNTSINSWNTSSGSNFSNMFRNSAYNQGLDWDMSSASNIEYMFRDADFNHPSINNWDTSNISGLCRFVFYNSNFNQPLDNWDTSGITSMQRMFANSGFNQDIGMWDVSNVTSMYQMFDNNFSFDQDLSFWCVTNITSEPIDFAPNLSAENEPVWGTCPQPMIMEVDTSLDTGDDFSIETQNGTDVYDVEWGDGNVDYAVSGTTNHIYSTGGIYEIKIKRKFPGFKASSYRDKITKVKQWGDVPYKSFEFAFQYAGNLVITATDSPDLSLVTNMRNSFESISGITGDVTGWDTSTITRMDSMWRQVDDIASQNIGSWDVSSVQYFNSMFQQTNFNQNISSWNTSSGQYFANMFRNNSSFNQDISSWDVSNATNMSWMFAYSSFNQDIGGWDVSGSVFAQSMFQNASSFNQDISSWDVSNWTSMDYMFVNATNFNQDLTNWCVTNFSTEPAGNFADGSSLETVNYPVWGTCPAPELEGVIGGESGEVILERGTTSSVIYSEGDVGSFRSAATDGKGTIIFTKDSPSGTKCLLYISNDYGQTWTKDTTNGYDQSAGIGYDYTSDRFFLTDNFTGGTSNTKYSTDQGSTWTNGDTIPRDSAVAVYDFGRSKSIALTSYLNLSAPEETTNGGQTWTPMTYTPSSTARPASSIYVPYRDKVMVSCFTNILSEYDGSWSESSLPTGSARGIAYSPNLDRIIIVDRDSGPGSSPGVYYSDNGGSTWTKTTTGLSNSYDYRGSKWNQSLGLFFVFTTTGDSYYSSDGISWTKTNTTSLTDASSSGSVSLSRRYVDFSVDNSTPGTGVTINFTEESFGLTDADSYLWDFGDGNTSTSQNPSHSYSSTGTYDVTLRVTNYFGSSIETKTGFITVS